MFTYIYYTILTHIDVPARLSHFTFQPYKKIIQRSLLSRLWYIYTAESRKLEVLFNTISCSNCREVDIKIYTRQKKETHHLELFNSQENHN